MKYFNFVKAIHHLNSHFTRQQTTVNLNSANLNSPYILKIGGKGLNLSGKILLDGSILKQLRNSYEQFDLAPHLVKGKNIVEILGNYSPTSSSIRVEFSGHGIGISQQSSSNGKLEHVLTVNVY